MVQECEHIRLVTVFFLDHEYEELGLKVEIRTSILPQVSLRYNVHNDFVEFATAQLTF